MSSANIARLSGSSAPSYTTSDRKADARGRDIFQRFARPISSDPRALLTNKTSPGTLRDDSPPEFHTTHLPLPREGVVAQVVHYGNPFTPNQDQDMVDDMLETTPRLPELSTAESTLSNALRALAASPLDRLSTRKPVTSSKSIKVPSPSVDSPTLPPKRTIPRKPAASGTLVLRPFSQNAATGSIGSALTTAGFNHIMGTTRGVDRKDSRRY